MIKMGVKAMIGAILVFLSASMINCTEVGGERDDTVKGGVDSMLAIRKIFYLQDIDDNGIVEPEELELQLKRIDTNGDGITSWEEISSYPIWKDTITKEFLFAKDFDGDGKSTIEDAKIYFGFERLVDITLKEFILIEAEYETLNKGANISVRSFVNAERDFLYADEDDDEIVSEVEYKVDFGLADSDRDGVISPEELPYLAVTRGLKRKHICPTAEESGCTLDDVLKLFKEADTDSNGELTFAEYVKYFGILMDLE